MKASVRVQTQRQGRMPGLDIASLLDAATKPRPVWVRQWPAMAVLAVSAICWSQVHNPSLLSVDAFS